MNNLKITSVGLVACILQFSGMNEVVGQSLVSVEFKKLYEYHIQDRKQPQVDLQDLSIEKLYAAPVDGCYYGLKDERNSYDPNGIDCESCLDNGGKLKINGSYVWGMTASNGKIYWGTANNLLCSAFSLTGSDIPGYETSCWVCEGATSETNDQLPPRVYVYQPADGSVKDITPVEATSDNNCMGYRSAGSLDGVVFMAGPDQVHGITLVAYSSSDDAYLGMSHFESIDGAEGIRVTNIRKWQVIDGVLYCGVKYLKNGVASGAILRWRGDKEDPFRFEAVGFVESEAAELAFHDGCIYVGGWPAGKGGASIYRSPKLPEGGFTKAMASTWEKVWDYSQYEIEPFVLTTTGIGGFKSFKGKLYWGMLNITWGYPFYVESVYGAKSAIEKAVALLGCMRSSALFRASDFSTADDVELLYGEKELPQYNRSDKSWSILPNASGYQPKWGRSGIGNLFTNYIWAMEEYKDCLYVGTMDLSNLINPFMQSSLVSSEYSSVLRMALSLLKLDEKQYGYECLMIKDHEEEPTLMTNNGLGNPAAYGIRNMLQYGDVLYFGTANPLSLHEEGGWELYSVVDPSTSTSVQLKPRKAEIVYRQSDHYVELSSLSGAEITQLNLIDIQGRVVYTDRPQSNVAVVVTDGIASGLYIAQLKLGEVSEIQTVKILIK